jgi:hypothetical protein
MYILPVPWRLNILISLQRVDPNRIYWQRTEAARAHVDQPPGISTDGSNSGTARPPSYVSEDGIAYVIEAAPRSIAPTVDVPLPQHPSERGRIYLPPRA